MQMLFEFLPIIVFFIIYKTNGIYIATFAAIIMSLMQFIVYWVSNKKADKIQLIMLALIILLGGATLWFRNPIYIKWKPTVINWLLALLFLLTEFWGNKPLLAMMLERKVTLPLYVWQRLNRTWVTFFFFLGAANIYVAYHYSTSIWVNFKLFGVLGLTIAFIILQAFYLAKHVNIDP